jgi:hypothetical protein
MDMKHARNIVKEVMGEYCIYGGLLATRAEVYADLMESTVSRGQPINHLFLDRLTWMPEKATPEQISRLMSAGFTLNAMRGEESKEKQGISA